MRKPYDCVAIGGGPASFFALLQLKQHIPNAKLLIVEKQHRPLEKVYLTGGGRCNLTHACFDPKELSEFYPRGKKELRGAFYHFQPRDTIAWFQAYGVPIKTEEDGRVFPQSNRAEEVVNVLLTAAADAHIDIWTEAEAIDVVEAGDEGEETTDFLIQLKDGRAIPSKTVLFGTGGNRKTLKHLAQLGITIVPPLPSLFSFLIKEPWLNALAGTPLSNVSLQFEDMQTKSHGGMIITHQGLSGPAVLKLSAFEARHLAERDYQATLLIDWLPDQTAETLRQKLQNARKTQAKKQIGTTSPFEQVPHKLWQALLQHTALLPEKQWSQLRKDEQENLIQLLKKTSFQMSGKSTHKQEFVTSGGVKLKSVDFRTMQSKQRPGFFFAGETLNIDGVTGGFNLQNAWTTGWIAGNGIASHLSEKK